MNIKKLKTKLAFKLASKKLKFAEKRRDATFKRLKEAQLAENQAYERLLESMEVKS